MYFFQEQAAYLCVRILTDTRGRRMRIGIYVHMGGHLRTGVTGYATWSFTLFGRCSYQLLTLQALRPSRDHPREVETASA